MAPETSAGPPVNLHWDGIRRSISRRFRDAPVDWLDGLGVHVLLAARSSKVHALNPAAGCGSRTGERAVVSLATLAPNRLCAKCVDADSFARSCPDAFDLAHAKTIFEGLGAVSRLTSMLARPTVAIRDQGRIAGLLTTAEAGLAAARADRRSAPAAKFIARKLASARKRMSGFQGRTDDARVLAAYARLLDRSKCVAALGPVYRRTHRLSGLPNLVAACAGFGDMSPAASLYDYLNYENGTNLAGASADRGRRLAAELAAALPVPVYADLIAAASPQASAVDVIAANLSEVVDRVVAPAAVSVHAHATSTIRKWVSSAPAVVTVTTTPSFANQLRQVFGPLDPAGVTIEQVDLPGLGVRLVVLGPERLIDAALKHVQTPPLDGHAADDPPACSVASRDPSAVLLLVTLATEIADHDLWSAAALAA